MLLTSIRLGFFITTLVASLHVAAAPRLLLRPRRHGGELETMFNRLCGRRPSRCEADRNGREHSGREWGQNRRRAAAPGGVCYTAARAQIRRWAAHVGRAPFPLLVRLAGARWTALRAAGVEAPSASAVRRFYRDGVRIAYRDPIAVADLAIDGDDLVAAGIAPGPAIGQILGALRDAVLEDPTRNTREALLALVRQQSRG